MHSKLKDLKIVCVWIIEPCQDEDELYASRKLGYNEVVKQYNLSNFTCTHYIYTIHYKNKTIGTLWILPGMWCYVVRWKHTYG